MAESFVPALVPRAGTDGSASLARAQVDTRGMSVAELPALSRETRRLYRIAALDDRGRIAEQSVVQLVFDLSEHLQPEPRALTTVAAPQAEDVAFAVDGDPHGVHTAGS